MSPMHWIQKGSKWCAPVGDLCREFQAPEGGQEALHALLKALRLPRIAGRRHDRHIDVGPHQRYYVAHLFIALFHFRVYEFLFVFLGSHL